MADEKRVGSIAAIVEAQDVNKRVGSIAAIVEAQDVNKRIGSIAVIVEATESGSGSVPAMMHYKKLRTA